MHPYVLLVGAEPVGYGEVWVDAEEREAELARIAIAPARRSRGLGRALTRLLTGEARRLGFSNIWLRVVPTNRSAISAYTAAGFTRATAEEERAFNAGQPRAYVWMRASEE